MHVVADTILKLSVAGVLWWALRRKRWACHALLCLCALLAVCAVAGGIAGAWQNRITIHDEVSVLSIAAAHRNGQPLYPAAAYPGEYALLYGPVTYLVYEIPMLFGAEWTGAFQVWTLAAVGAALTLTWFALRGVSTHALAWMGTVFMALIVVRNADYAWAVKGDAWILLLTAAAFFAVVRLKPRHAAWALAFASAAAIDVKATQIVSVLLPLSLLWQRSRRAATLCVLLIVVLTASPFLVPGIDLPSYLHVLRAASGHGLSARLFRLSALTFGAVYLPCIGCGMWAFWIADRGPFRAWFKERGTFLLLFGVAVSSLIAAGSKNGAGPWHLMPLAIPCALMATECLARALRSPRPRSPVLAFAPAAVFFTLCGWAIPVKALSDARARLHDNAVYVTVPHREIEQDLDGFAKAHAGSTIAVGYSDDLHYAATFTRQVILLHHQPLLIDADARNEADLQGAPIPAAVLQALSSCRIQYWLIPKGGRPFSMSSLYYLDGTIAQRDMFPQDFQEAFFAAYKESGSLGYYFDVWTCNDSNTY